MTQVTGMMHPRGFISAKALIDMEKYTRFVTIQLPILTHWNLVPAQKSSAEPVRWNDVRIVLCHGLEEGVELARAIA